jgi:hypothetical protein
MKPKLSVYPAHEQIRPVSNSGEQTNQLTLINTKYKIETTEKHEQTYNYKSKQ